MTPLRVLLLPLAALALVSAGCGGGGDESVPGDAVAVVGDTEVKRAEFDAILGRTKTAYKNADRKFPAQGTPEFNNIKSQAVGWLVQKAQYEEKAEDLEIEITPQQVDKKLAEVKQQYFQGDDKKYRQALKQQGYTEDDLKDTLRIQLIQDEIYKKVTDGVEVSDDDIKKFYDENKAERFTTPESRDVRHILVAVCAEGEPKTPTCKRDVAARTLTNRLYAQLKGGGDFAKLAKRFSDDPSSKDLGGKLNIVRGQTVAPFERTAFSLAKDEISRPVKTTYGYHIIQALTPVKPKKVQPLAKVKDQIRQEVLGNKRNEAMTEWVKDTREDFCDGELSFQVGFKPNPDPCKPNQQTTATAATQ